MTERAYDVAVANGPIARRWANRRMTWREFCERQREPRRTAETAAEYAAMGKAERDRIKSGPAFVGGYLASGRRTKAAVAHRSLLALDADNADADLEADWGLLVGSAACAWPTHSSSAARRRLRVVAPLSRDCTPEEYVPLALKVMETLGLARFDPTTAQPERLMYDASASSDAPFALWVADGAPLDVDAWLALYPDWRDASCWPLPAASGRAPGAARAGDPRAKRGEVGAFCRAYGVEECIEEFLSDVYEPARESGRYTYRAGSAYGGGRGYDGGWAGSDHATDPANTGHLANAWDLVRIHRYGGLDEGAPEGARAGSRPSDAAMREWARTLPRVSEELSRAQLGEAANDFEGEGAEWLSRLEHEARTGAVASSAGNIRLILENDPEMAGRLRHDVRTDAPALVACELPWRRVGGESPWGDVDDAGLRAWLEVKYGVQGRQKVLDAVALEAIKRPYDPVREFVEGLPAWDGVKRVERLLVERLGAPDTAYVRAVTRKVLCGAVRRALRPGCKFDYMLIIEGAQGLGKSSLLADLAGEWFTDGVSIGDMARPKDAAEKLQRNWIAEVAELDGMQKTSIEALKAFVTVREDNYRAAYARRAVKRPRRGILVGTVNNVNGYLRDASGNRRFWPVKATRAYRAGSMDEAERLQVWAEARALEPGEELFLTPELERCAAAAQREAMESDPREGLVEAYLSRPVPCDLASWGLAQRELFFEGDGGDAGGLVERAECSVPEVWHEALGGAAAKATRADSYAVAAMLRRLGWEPTGATRRLKAYGVTRVYGRVDDGVFS